MHEAFKKKFFQIGLVDCTRVEPLKQVLQDWTYGSYTRGRCSTCGSSLRGALKTGRRSGPPPPFFVMLQSYLIGIGASMYSGRESCCHLYARFFTVIAVTKLFSIKSC